MAIPGSPMTVVTFEIVAGAAARSAGGRAELDGAARTNRCVGVCERKSVCECVVWVNGCECGGM